MPFPTPRRELLAVAQLSFALGLLGLLGANAPAQAPRSIVPDHPRSAAVTTTSASRATSAPDIDGREDDAVWQSIAPTRGFRQFDPREDAAPTFDTEFRIAYDDRNLYVLVRAHDPHPDSIQKLLSRRDVRTNSDQIKILIDGFHDRRNAIELMVNPAGVQRDAAIYSDFVEDMSWDGVWEVGVQVDEKGWVAEFRVPFSQLRFTERDVNTFGFGIWRDIARLNQRDAWPLYVKSSRTIASQLGTVEAIRDVPGARRVELLPYAITRSVPDLSRPIGFNRSEFTAGLDAKAGLGTSLTVDATINPDFGQVESDPSILNLSAFETRFDERRPFFQEGIGLFRCGGPCDGPFYTRRIGRTPQLRSSASDPAFTAILGAAKITGRFSNGVTVAMLDAVTNRERGGSGATIEPQTNYFVMRAAREWKQGARSAGLLVTDVHRSLDAATEPYLRRSGTTAVAQYVNRFADNQYEFMAYSGRSLVAGSTGAIALTQRSSVHNFQRPDGDERYDPTRTSLSGGAIGGSFTKLRGTFKFNTFIRHSSPGQEMNDLGLVPTVGVQSIRGGVDYTQRSPGRWFRSSSSQLSGETQWSTGGMPVGRHIQLHANGTLHSNWTGVVTLMLNELGGINCVSCARGGPALRRSPATGARFDLIGDARMSLQPQGQVYFSTGDDGRSFTSSVDAGFNLRVASRFSASFAVGYDLTANDQQWVGNFGALLSDTTHFTFARLNQRTLAITSRLNWTATPTVSFQFYGQPFISSGAYSQWREFAAPRAHRYADRLKPYGGGANPAGFNVKQFTSNAVLRWEYRPASVLFLVWQQGRAQNNLNPGTFEASRDVQDLFSAQPQNTLLLKLSYWFNP